MNDRPTVSVLLPVHAGVRPEHLRRALESIAEQSLLPNEVVIVEDGPLPDPHVAALADFSSQSEFAVVTVRLEKNGGAGIANGAGLRAASSDWIAKADADDINMPDRLGRQLEFVLENGVDVCGAAMAEFDSDEENVTAVRLSPLAHRDIARRMRMNNPINHPASMFRRQAALDAGGYSEMRYMQDYDLFARMLADGARFANIAIPLVKFRADSRMYNRRKSREMNRSEWCLQHNLRRSGVISTPRMWANLALRLVFRRLPRPLLKAAYSALFHRRHIPR
jgi:glycosyltransferase involved in cell wall biosynthesis